jgi:hypothetical protein
MIEVGNENSTFKQFIDIVFTSEADFPISVHISDTRRTVYLMTKFGYLHILGLQNAKLIHRQQIDTERIFITTFDEPSGTLIAINVKGRVMGISIDAHPNPKPKSSLAESVKLSDALSTYTFGNEAWLTKQSVQTLEEIEKKLKQELDLVQKTVIKLKLLQENQKKSNECVVCYDRESNVILIPCGHLALCEECSKVSSVSKCPVCRSNIQQRVKVYTPT